MVNGDFTENLSKVDFTSFAEQHKLEPGDLMKKAYSETEFKEKLGFLVPYICKTLSKSVVEDDDSLFTSCESLLLHIADIGCPESLLIDFIDEAEVADNAKFKVILKCWQNCLTRSENHIENQLCWCFNTIIRHLNDSELPQDFNLEDKERALIECDSVIRSIIGLYEEIIFFSESIIDCFYLTMIGNIELLESTIQYLIKLLGKPIAWTDLKQGETKPLLRCICERICNLIIRLRWNVCHYLLKFDSFESSDDPVEDCFTKLSLSVLYYLVFVEGVCCDAVPSVYAPTFLMDQLIKSSLVLLNMSESLMQMKGVQLANAALLLVPDNAISSLYEHHQTLAETLPAIMVYSNNQEVRQGAVSAMRRFLYKVSAERRYSVLLNIQDVVKQPGFIGYLATVTKDLVASVLNGHGGENCNYFSGKRLMDLIKRFAYLENEEKTDLVENSDTVVSVLNLLRFIYLRDKKDESGMSALADWLEHYYIKPIRRGVEISVAHYELEIKGNHQDIPTPSVAIANDPTAKVTPMERATIAANAINILKLMDSLAVRVDECLRLSSSGSQG